MIMYRTKNPPYYPKIMEHLSKLVAFCGNKKTYINSQRQKLYTTFSNNNPIKVKLNNESIFLKLPKKTFLKEENQNYNYKLFRK